MRATNSYVGGTLPRKRHGTPRLPSMPQLTFPERLAAGRRGDAVDWFLSSAGVPAEAIAPTLGYDNAILGDGAAPRDRAAKVSQRWGQVAPEALATVLTDFLINNS